MAAPPKSPGKKPRQTGIKAGAVPRPKKAGLELTDRPRLAAFRALQEVRAGRPPEEALAVHGLLLSPKDLTLATAMVYECLRHQSYLDWLMKSRLSAGRAGPELALVLRLGLAQLLFFQRLGDHAVVSETVALAKIVAPGRQGLVNAVLRGLLRARDEEEKSAGPQKSGGAWPPRPEATGRPADDLALLHSCPRWLVQKLLDRFGSVETEELLVAGNQPTPPTLRANPLKTGRESLKELLPFPCRETGLSPWGLAAGKFFGRPEDCPGFAEGLFAVQDEASQLAALIAGPLAAGSLVLDACSGLGGKALALAAASPGARLVARDKDEAKLAALRKEVRRLGCANIEVEVRDLLAEVGPERREAFDLVLLDAPCSGLGVIRRRPDLKWNKKEEDLPRLAGLQLKLLKAAAEKVRPGGRLLYGVCTFSREEGPETAAKFLRAAPDFKAAVAEDWPEKLRPLLAPEGHLTLLPHRHQTDGFFWALFAKGEKR